MNQVCQLPVMFDPNQFQIIAAGAFIKASGKYPCIITSAEMKAVKNSQTAFYIQFTIEITDGELKGQSFIDRLNIANPNDNTRDMAFKSLTSYATAVGQQQAFADASVLCNRPLQLFVEATEEVSTTDPNKTNWSNAVKRWYYADGEEIQQGKYGSAKAQGTPPAGYGAPAPTAPAPAAAPAPQAGYAQPAPQQQPAYAPQQQPVQQPQVQQPAPQQAPAGQVTIQAGGYGAPAGQAPAGYVPPAAPSFAAPQ